MVKRKITHNWKIVSKEEVMQLDSLHCLRHKHKYIISIKKKEKKTLLRINQNGKEVLIPLNMVNDCLKEITNTFI